MAMKIEKGEIFKLFGIMLIAWAAIIMADPVKDFLGNNLGFLPGGPVMIGLVLLVVAAYLFKV